MPVVTDLAALDRLRSRVESVGFEWHGELGIAGRRYCTLDDAGLRRAQLHFFERARLVSSAISLSATICARIPKRHETMRARSVARAACIPMICTLMAMKKPPGSRKWKSGRSNGPANGAPPNPPAS